MNVFELKINNLLYHITLSLFLVACVPATKEESTVKAIISHKNIAEELDYTSCLEKGKQLVSVSDIKRFKRKTPWLTNANIENVAAFHNLINEYQFVDRQLSVECEKLPDYSLWHPYEEKLLKYLYKHDIKFEYEIIGKKLRYTIDMYNKGLLKKSAAFKISQNKKDYEFFVVAQFAKNSKVPIIRAEYPRESTLRFFNNKDTVKFEKKDFLFTGPINYYLIIVESPCDSQTPKIEKILIKKEEIVSYYVRIN